MAGALAGAALFQFFGNANRGYIDTASLFYWWGFQWANPGSETEHGWLILGLSAWLFWRNLGIFDSRFSNFDSRATQSRFARWQPAFPAVAAMAAGLALHALGFVAQQARISILALLLFTWGVIALADLSAGLSTVGSAKVEGWAKADGKRWGAAAMFPLAFMVFAIPINALDSLGFWLRVWVVDASGVIARTAGIAVLQSGTQLVAPDGAYNYDVAAACSGIRSLTAMAALSLLAGYLNFQSWWRRAFVLLSCFPLVYVGNVARIVAIIFAAEAGGPKWGDIAHEVMGYGVFVIVLGGVLGAASLLRRLLPEASCPTGDSPRSSISEAPKSCHPLDDKLRGRGVGGVAGLVVVLAVGEMVFLRQVASAPARGGVGVVLAADAINPVGLPAFLGTEWIGRRAEVSTVEREILPPDTGYSRKQYVAVADPRRQVFLSIVLSGRDRTSIHRPELCLVGQGWTIADTAPHRFAVEGRLSAAVPATLLRVRREVQTPAAGGKPRGKAVVPQLVAYWFVGGDEVVATHWERLWRDAWNRVARGRADRWAYVLMQTDAADGEIAGLARMQAVLDATLPVFAPQVFAPRKP